MVGRGTNCGADPLSVVLEHNDALRRLASRLVGIPHGCLKTGTLYDEAWIGMFRGTAARRDNHQVTEQPGPADSADAIWNRAALHDGGLRPRHGDVALSAVLRLHGLAMSGGLLDAVERLADPELDAAEYGYAWLGHPDAARLVAYVRDQIRVGVLDDTDRADHLEEEADHRYADIIPSDETLDLAFHRRLAAEPSAFASAGD